MARKQLQDEEGWKLYNEEEEIKRREREKKMARNMRKMELKKEKVVEKIMKHDRQV